MLPVSRWKLLGQALGIICLIAIFHITTRPSPTKWDTISRYNHNTAQTASNSTATAIELIDAVIGLLERTRTLLANEQGDLPSGLSGDSKLVSVVPSTSPTSSSSLTLSTTPSPALPSPTPSLTPSPTQTQTPTQTHTQITQAVLPTPTAEIAPNASSCIMWRRTGGCSGYGAHEPEGDLPCTTTIQTKESGFCECSDKLRVAFDCGHDTLDCATVCQHTSTNQASSYGCQGWRQTGECKGHGKPDSGSNTGCDTVIYGFRSGYCQCDQVTFNFDCGHRAFTCKELCASPTLSQTCPPVGNSLAHVQKGVDAARKSSILVAALFGGKDTESKMGALRANLERVDKIVSRFGEYRAIIVVDQDYAAITEWQQKDPQKRITLNPTPSIPYNPDMYGAMKVASERFQRMASLRNAYMDLLENEEYLLLIDLDISWFDIRALVATMGDPNIPEWGGMCAFGKYLGGYFDTLATRAPFSWGQGQSYLRCEGHHSGGLLWQCRGAIQEFLFYATKQSQVEVDSCFGGVAFYKTQYVRDCRYQGFASEPPSAFDCEHVSFHQCMAKNFSATHPNSKGLFVNKDFEVYYTPDQELGLVESCTPAHLD